MSGEGRTRFHADWVLPISAPPLRDGWLDVEDGVVTAVGDVSPPSAASRVVHLGSGAVLPGLVNAHTHLELSALNGAVRPASSMPAWARDVMAQVARCDDSATREAVAAAIVELRASGTALVGDITNTGVSRVPLEASPLEAVVFHEVLGFNATADDAAADARRLAEMVAASDHERVWLRAAAHAPYSVSPALFRALAAAVPGPRSVHVGESREELQFLRDGGGAWRRVLEERGRWVSDWRPPGTGPVDYLGALGWLRDDTLAVHGVQLTRSELARVAAAGTTLVTCPRSNRWTGAGVPPVEAFYESGTRVAIGTDSLASVPDLNLFSELAELRRVAPSVPAASILDSATRGGAAALGRSDALGVIAPSRRAALIVVQLPGPVEDVEEYLVSGIEPEQVTWLDELS